MVVNFGDLITKIYQSRPFYLHYCFWPHQFDEGEIQYGTQEYELDSQSDRRGFHAFTNGHGGTTYYSVSAYFEYGSW